MKRLKEAKDNKLFHIIVYKKNGTEMFQITFDMI